MKYLFYIFPIILFTSIAAAATQVENTKIKELYLSKKHGDFVFIRLDMPAPRSACSKNGTWDYTLELSSEFGRAMYSTVLSAYVAGKSLTATGNDGGLCNETGSVESLGGLRLM